MDIAVHQEQRVPSQVGRRCVIAAPVEQPVLMGAAVHQVIHALP